MNKKLFQLFKCTCTYLKHWGYARATSKHSKSSSLARFVYETPLKYESIIQKMPKQRKFRKFGSNEYKCNHVYSQIPTDVDINLKLQY